MGRRRFVIILPGEHATVANIPPELATLVAVLACRFGIYVLLVLQAFRFRSYRNERGKTNVKTLLDLHSRYPRTHTRRVANVHQTNLTNIAICLMFIVRDSTH